LKEKERINVLSLFFFRIKTKLYTCILSSAICCHLFEAPSKHSSEALEEQSQYETEEEIQIIDFADQISHLTY
jgi:hypothetical protein